MKNEPKGNGVQVRVRPATLVQIERLSAAIRRESGENCARDGAIALAVAEALAKRAK